MLIATATFLSEFLAPTKNEGFEIKHGAFQSSITHRFQTLVFDIPCMNSPLLLKLYNKTTPNNN